MALSDEFHTIMSFKDFCTIKHPEWYEPQVLVGNKVKMPRKKVLFSKYYDASKIEDDKTIASIIPLALSYEPHNTNAHDG
jgi:hypothetical protein